MRGRASYPGRVDLSRLLRALGGEVRRHLDTTRGFPTHHRVTPKLAGRVRRKLKSPDPGVRARAIATLQRRILGRPPARPYWAAPVTL